MVATQSPPMPEVFGWISVVADAQVWEHLSVLAEAGCADPCAVVVQDLASEGRIWLAGRCKDLLPSPAEEARGAMEVGFASRRVVCDILRRNGHAVAARELMRDDALKAVILDADRVELRKPPALERTPVNTHA